MRQRKQQRTRSRPGTSHGGTTSLVEEEVICPKQNGQTDYERERLLRIEENRARMEALGLSKMAASLSRNREVKIGDKGEGNWRDCEKEEDEDYNPSLDGPNEDGDDLSSSSEGFVDEDDDEDYVSGGKSKARCSAKNKKSGVKKKVPVMKQELVDFMNEDEALKMAIAFSLQDSREVCEASNERPGKAGRPQLSGKKKGRKLVTNRVQMNEDDVVIHFCQLDEVGKGSITARDLERIASSHDFTWTDKELLDMIRCFDKDGDGKLTMEDFRNIVVKCNLLQTFQDA
ncbi:hypothetical protein V2J09_003896 [Rumex salicifolius]